MSDVNSYRPISLLPTLGKLTERVKAETDMHRVSRRDADRRDEEFTVHICMARRDATQSVATCRNAECRDASQRRVLPRDVTPLA